MFCLQICDVSTCLLVFGNMKVIRPDVSKSNNSNVNVIATAQRGLLKSAYILSWEQRSTLPRKQFCCMHEL